MRAWKLLFTGLLMLAISLPLLIQAQQGVQPRMAMTEELVLGEALTAQKVKGLLAKAAEVGYQVSVQEEPCDLLKWSMGCPTKVLAVKLIKTGTTKEGRGILNVKWDEREAWNVLFIQQGTNLRLIKSEGIREEKAPVAGAWRVAEKLEGLPAPLRWGGKQ